MGVAHDTDVLICGAGAAGLTLALDLARRDVSFRLIDRLEKPFAGSRGKGIQPRTQEIFEDLGVIDRLAAIGGMYPMQRVHRDDGTYEDTQDVAVAPATVAEPYRTPLLVPQVRTEAILRERLAEGGVRPDYGTRLIGFADEDGGVNARVTGADGDEEIRCRYLIGADGGRSFVRHEMGIGFPGRTLGLRAMVADIVVDGLDRAVWHRFNEGDMQRQMGFCPLPHGDSFQLQAPIPSEGEADLSVGGIQAFIDARLPGRAIRVRDVRWASAYAMNARLADRYRVGRVLLMGDAAHIHPPTGGQGLNTSVQDAYNLGWKLAAVLAGAPAGLLDTYEEERRPIAAGMLGLATGLLEKARQGDMRRGREVHQLDLGYRGASLSLDGVGMHGRVRAGDRMPDAMLRGAGGQTRRLFDLLAGPYWTLLVGDGAPPVTPRAGLAIWSVGPTGALLDRDDMLGLADGRCLLVRPDGYLGAVLPPTAQVQLAPYLARVLPVVDRGCGF